MYAGRIVEQGSVFDVLSQPRHPYTQGLLDSVPSRSARAARLKQIRGMPPSVSTFPPAAPSASARPRDEAARRRPYAPAATTDSRGHHPLRRPRVSTARERPRRRRPLVELLASKPVHIRLRRASATCLRRCEEIAARWMASI
jgi:oligopeptide/dipeptide ABC transporter ATP-binding protein